MTWLAIASLILNAVALLFLSVLGYRVGQQRAELHEARWEGEEAREALALAVREQERWEKERELWVERLEEARKEERKNPSQSAPLLEAWLQGAGKG